MQNLTRIEIENFQSVEFISLPLNNTGVHWINGKPNVGKSAVLKAIQALFTNVSNNRYKEMIRDGQDAFRVKGYFGEDNWVELTRGEDDGYTWVLDGQAGSSSRTQGKVPYDVKQFYDLYWTGDKIKRYLNFTLVGDQLFFVETSAGDNTIILEKALGTDRLSRVGKYSETEKREVRADLRTYRGFHEEADNKLEALSIQVSEGEEVLHILDRLEKTLDSEMLTFETTNRLVEQTHRLAQIAQVVNQVEEGLRKVDSGLLHSEIKLFDKAEKLHEEETRLAELKQQEEELTVNVTKEQLAELTTEIKDYTEVVTRADRMATLIETKAELDNTVEELSVNITSDNVNELNDLIKEYDYVITRTDKLAQLNVVKDNNEKELEATMEQLEELLQEKEDFLSQFDVCPFCEQPIGEEFEHAHA